MRICILANPRTGSSSLYSLLERQLPKTYHCVSEPFNPDYMKSISDNRDHSFFIESKTDVLLKHIYYQVPPKFDSNDKWVTWLFNNFDKVILLDRRDRLAQAESFVYHQSKNLSSWHIKQVYKFKDIDSKSINERIEYLNKDGESLLNLSKECPIFYYEDIFIKKDGNTINSIFEYLEIMPDKKLIERYILSDINKVRIPIEKQTLL
jgi:hypothetical protein